MTEVTSGVIVRTRHMREGKMCVNGSREWFEHRGLNWREFVKNGLPVEIIEATGDETALRVCRIARAEHDVG